MATTAAAEWEYRNDYFTIDIRESGQTPGGYLFSSGLSISMFHPIIWGRTGICSNAAFKGLQQLRADVSYYALQRGIVTSNASRTDSIRAKHAHGWYQEDPLLLENATPEAVQDILAFAARNLVQTILTASHPEVSLPAGDLEPKQMQRFLESLGIPNYVEMAPPPIARQQAA